MIQKNKDDGGGAKWLLSSPLDAADPTYLRRGYVLYPSSLGRRRVTFIDKVYIDGPCELLISRSIDELLDEHFL